MRAGLEGFRAAYKAQAFEETGEEARRAIIESHVLQRYASNEHSWAECGQGRYEKSLGVGMKADGTMGDVPTEIRTSAHGWWIVVLAFDYRSFAFSSRPKFRFFAFLRNSYNYGAAARRLF